MSEKEVLVLKDDEFAIVFSESKGLSLIANKDENENMSHLEMIGAMFFVLLNIQDESLLSLLWYKWGQLHKEEDEEDYGWNLKDWGLKPEQ